MLARVDKLNRRIRFSGAQRKGKRTEIDDEDRKMWAAIHSHGPLPTHYLYAFTGKRNYNGFQHRLTRLRNGTETDGPYLIRCPIDSPDPLSATNVYRLHENAQAELSRLPAYYPLERKGWAIHQLMGSCITASIELACRAHAIRFMPRHELQAKNNKALKIKLANDEYLVPDELFGFDYGNEKYKFFVCEWDRKSEPWRRDMSKGVDFVTKLDSYLEVLRKEGLKQNTMVLIVTTSASRAKSIKDYLLEKDSKLAKRFLVNTLDYFAHPWKMPPILTDVLEPWPRPDGSVFDLTVHTKP